VVLATDALSMADPIAAVPTLDRAQRGAVADQTPDGVVRRAEPGPHGPLVFEATQRDGRVTVQVFGPPSTPTDHSEIALTQARAWIGADDPDGDLTELTAGHPGLHRAARHIGPVRLSQMPRVQEAVGRAVLGAVVTRIEAERSATQLAALLGTPATDGLWCWPTADTLARTPAHVMRRCGVNRKSAAALHGAALDDPQLERVRGDVDRLDRRLRAIPGIGVWTSSETRRFLGDPDAVPLGDDGLPEIVCHALAGAEGDDCTDELMLELLAPYEEHRGRVIRLVMLAVFRGLLPRHPRRAPRAALSAHRYW
jgi:3-methyladenine DNA glycosylase/8-oxoguanine DNA glycosylase